MAGTARALYRVSAAHMETHMIGVSLLERRELNRALVPLREENVKAALGGVTSLPSFHEELNRLRCQVAEEAYADFAIEYSTVKMMENGFFDVDGTGFSYTKHALNQAVSRIKPDGVVGMAGYLAVCPPDLRSLNFNYWHHEKFADADASTKGNNVLLRIRKGEFGTMLMRAMVSQSYVPIDDMPILTSLNVFLPTGSHLRAVRGDMKSRFDIIWPSMQHNLKSGEPLAVALRVINSETGASSVRLEPMVYDMYTYSYFIVPRAGRDVAIRHIGEAKNRLRLAYDNVMTQVEPFIEMLKGAYNDYCESYFNNDDNMWKCLGKYFQLSESKLASIKLSVDRSQGLSRGIVADAMVKVAQEMNLDGAEELQTAAGMLIMKGWRPLTRFLNDEE